MRFDSGVSHIAMTAAERQTGHLMRAPDHPAGDGSGGAPAADAPAADAPAADAPAADAFSSAFDEFALPEGTKKDEAAPATDAPAADAPAADAPAADAPAADAPAADAPAADAPKDKPPASADDILAGLEKLINKPGAPAADAPAADTPAAEAPPEIYNDEEKAFLATYEKDWGDVQKGEALIRRGEYRDLVQHIFKQVVDFVRPLQETTQLLATRTHLGDIETAIPDYSDNLRDDVTKWVESQPAYLHDAYNRVINEGTVEEVKDLVERYRTATGSKPAGGQEQPKPKGKDNELSGPAKQAAAALAPVESKRSGVQEPSDPSSFDDAWTQAAKELG